MKDNRIKNVTDNIHLPEDVKKRIKASCADQAGNESARSRVPGMKMGMRIAAAAACLAALSITAYAMTELMDFSFEREGDTVIIGAKLPEEVKSEIDTEPVRAWNAGEGEISVKLGFAYMPEDMSERDNTPAKWNGTADYNRCITFSGFDLRISDLETIIDGINKAEHFTAGVNEAYLLTSDSEIAVYDKTMYVLFADEHLVVKAYVGEGITEEEIKAIAAGMTVEETDDAAHALPISNEGAGAGSDDTSIPDVIVLEDEKVYKSDLLSIGDTAEYDEPWNGISVTALGFETVDSIAELDSEGFYDMTWMKQFTDENGNFVPYKRTGVDREKGKFAETVDMTKKMILVTVQLDSDTAMSDHDVRAHLNTFKLSGLAVDEDGTVHPGRDAAAEYVIDRTPGRHAGTCEPEYMQDLGGGRFVVGYILDADECEGDYFYQNTVADIYYSLEK